MVRQSTLEISATASGNGSQPYDRLFKENYAGIAQDIRCLADMGYIGIDKLHPTIKFRLRNRNFIRLLLRKKLRIVN